MSEIWVTVDDYVVSMGQSPYTSDEMAMIRNTTNAVSAFIRRVRPDIDPPASVTGPDGEIFVSNQDLGGSPQATITWAALELSKRWVEKRGSGQTSSFQDLGYIPQYGVDKDISDALQIGRSSMPVIA